MHITFVKKIKTDGTECRKCIEVQSRLEKDGYIEKINAIVIADENDENSAGIKLAKKYPKYSWHKSFGYGTSNHINEVKKYGITKHHRKTFKPIHNILMSSTRETL